ncbi:MAG TPA: siderophore-interacting protein [Sporichthya sp.]|nr:siderophore-interacting protein [Sporichthya sp.]
MARDGDVRSRGWTGEVLDVSVQSPSLIRVELGGPGLVGFTTLGVPDEACVFEFPVPDAVAGLRPNPGRWYSLQKVQPEQLTIGIVVHPGGLGSGWAEAASVGDMLRITQHNSWFSRPAAAGWQVLLGDITALPAIMRIVTESAADLPTRAIVEIPDPGDEVQWAHAADIRWVYNPGLLAGDSVLLDLARNLRLPDGPGYVYVAGEASATRAVRKLLRQERGLPGEQFGGIGYWRRSPVR